MGSADHLWSLSPKGRTPSGPSQKSPLAVPVEGTFDKEYVVLFLGRFCVMKHPSFGIVLLISLMSFKIRVSARTSSNPMVFVCLPSFLALL